MKQHVKDFDRGVESSSLLPCTSIFFGVLKRRGRDPVSRRLTSPYKEKESTLRVHEDNNDGDVINHPRLYLFSDPFSPFLILLTKVEDHDP